MEANVSHVGGTTDVPKKIDSENETDNMENISYDEADTIDVSNVFEHPIDPSQEHMPEDYVNSSSRTQPSAKRGIFFKSEPKPDQTSMILIPHAYQTDKEAGDYFGATLYTYTWSSEQKFKYQHLLKDIKGGYPAQKMSICKGDELVFIGQTFTPNLDHTAVLNCFHHDVKVDGKTRFCLVLRKSEKKQWYETSAILSPNHREHHHNGNTIVEKPKYGPAKPIRCPPKQIVFSIYDTSLYMFIDKAGIHGVPLLNNSIFVNKTVEISFNPSSTKAALFGTDGTSYVRIDDQRKIRISDESACTWFECQKNGNDNIFSAYDLFLAYDKIDKKFVMSKRKDGRNCVKFQDVGRVKGIDHPDYACASELAQMDAEEIEDTDDGYASNGSQEKDTWMPDDPIFLSADNLDMD